MLRNSAVLFLALITSVCAANHCPECPYPISEWEEEQFDFVGYGAVHNNSILQDIAKSGLSFRKPFHDSFIICAIKSVWTERLERYGMGSLDGPAMAADVCAQHLPAYELSVALTQKHPIVLPIGVRNVDTLLRNKQAVFQLSQYPGGVQTCVELKIVDEAALANVTVLWRQVKLARLNFPHFARFGVGAMPLKVGVVTSQRVRARTNLTLSVECSDPIVYVQELLHQQQGWPARAQRLINSADGSLLSAPKAAKPPPALMWPPPRARSLPPPAGAAQPADPALMTLERHCISAQSYTLLYHGGGDGA